MNYFSLKSIVSAAALTLAALVVTSCGDDDEPNPPTVSDDDNNLTISVESQSGQDGTVDFGQNADRLQISVSANVSTEYVLKVSGDSDWLFVDKASGSFVAGQSQTVTLYANRRGLDPGVHDCKLIVSAGGVDKEVPVSVNITEFAPLGYCRKYTSCDDRLSVQFRGCYKRDGYVMLKYRITNNGDDIRGLKLWSHPSHSYFTDNGTRYDKDSGMTSVFGSQSGTGDLMTPLRSGETINCVHMFRVGDKMPSSSLAAHMMIYNYGTGDWQCTGKYIDFYDLECENLDSFDPDYRPAY